MDTSSSSSKYPVSKARASKSVALVERSVALVNMASQKKANIWLTSGATLLIIAAFVLVAVRPIIADPYNESRAGSLLSRAQKRITLPQLLAPRPPAANPAPPATTSPTGGEKVPAPDPIPTPAPQPPENQITVPSPGSQPPAGQPGPSGTGVLPSPQAGARWAKASIQTIRWTAGIGQGYGVALRLQKGGTRYAGVSSVIGGGGTGPYGDYSGSFLRDIGAFDWVVPSDLPIGSDYNVDLINTKGQVIAKSPVFSIAEKENAFRFSAPAGGSVSFGSQYALRWKHPEDFVGNIDIAIYQKSRGFDGLSYIAKNVPASGPDTWLHFVDGQVWFTWSVNAGNNLSQSNGNGGYLVPGEAVVIVTSTDHAQSGSSASFIIQ